MPEVHSVWSTVRPPKDENDLGQVTAGYYTLADGSLTMTDSKGAAVRDLSTGEPIRQKMKPGDDPAAVARRLTMQIYRMLRGEGAGAVPGFGRKLSYPASGLA